MYFEYGAKETDYLKSKDKKLAEVIDRIGHIERPVDRDLFSAVVHHIIGQQISTKAQQSIWKKMNDDLGEITADTLISCGREQLQKFGTTFKKTDYILDFAEKVKEGQTYKNCFTESINYAVYNTIFISCRRNSSCM